MLVHFPGRKPVHFEDLVKLDDLRRVSDIPYTVGPTGKEIGKYADTDMRKELRKQGSHEENAEG